MGIRPVYHCVHIGCSRGVFPLQWISIGSHTNKIRFDVHYILWSENFKPIFWCRLFYPIEQKIPLQKSVILIVLSPCVLLAKSFTHIRAPAEIKAVPLLIGLRYLIYMEVIAQRTLAAGEFNCNKVLRAKSLTQKTERKWYIHSCEHSCHGPENIPPRVLRWYLCIRARPFSVGPLTRWRRHTRINTTRVWLAK